MILDSTIISDKYLVKNHGNGFYLSPKPYLVMDSIGLKIIEILNHIGNWEKLRQNNQYCCSVFDIYYTELLS